MQGRACTSAHQTTLELWISVFQPLQCAVVAATSFDTLKLQTRFCLGLEQVIRKAPDSYLSRFSILMSRLRSSHLRTQSKLCFADALTCVSAATAPHPHRSSPLELPCTASSAGRSGSSSEPEAPQLSPPGSLGASLQILPGCWDLGDR